ncbi:MAG: 3'(2'),5'-bisphosphate nucleotidase CysQ [Bacteroidales bacterium]|nr:3'(2'),5'-bisphosphate nucleotidase CysQ [Candidatus Equimonas faecalis]
MQAFLDIALRAALEAGAEELRIYNLPAEQQEVELKADQSPLTLADRRAHDIICRHLAETGLPILSEEGSHLPYDERSGWQQYWCVDPLDGTKEFVKHSGEFSVNIALMTPHDSTWHPTLGVVFFPATGLLYYTDGQVARRAQVADGTDLTCFTTLPEPHANRPFTVVASLSHMNAATEGYIAGLRTIHPDLRLTQAGSSLKICRVAEGSADIYPRLAPTCEWDTAAAHAVVRAAGGEIVSPWNGRPLCYNKPKFLNPDFVVRPTR